MNSRREIAWHEAAHFVIAYRFDHGTGTVTIEPNAGLDGSSRGECEWADGSKDREMALVYLAGLAGQRLVRPSASEADGAGDDYDNARRLLRGASLADAEREASQLVQSHRKAIAALAEALLESGTLHVDEIRDEPGFIVDCVDEGEDWRAMLPIARMKWAAFGGA